MDSYKKKSNRREFINIGALSVGLLISTRLPSSNKMEATSKTGKFNNIPTLTGDIDPSQLGTTLMHEHILFFSSPAPDDRGFKPIPEDLRAESVEFAAALLNDAARVGIETVVDLTPFRPIDMYEEIAKRTPVKIVASTGFYRRSKTPKWMADMDDEYQIEEHMLKEAVEGIGGTKIRAGIIKIAEESAIFSNWEKKVFRAAARIQNKIDIPIATHTGNALEQFELLINSGANPSRVFFSHVDVSRKGNIGDLIKIVKAGAYIEVDTFGQDFYTPKSELVSFLRSVCDSGFAKNVFISIDSNWHWANGKKMFEGSEAPAFDPNASNRTFAYMITDAVPWLLKSGFSIKEINTFLIDNPRNFFTGKS